MINIRVASLVVFAAAAIVASPAQAQYIIYMDSQGNSYTPAPPLYPYTTQQPAQVYPQPYPYAGARPAPQARSARKADPAMIEELRKRRQAKLDAAKKKEEKEAKQEAKREAKTVDGKKIDKTVVVREKPIVRKTYRIVDDPPIVVRREIDADQVASHPQGRAQEIVPPAGRIIRAEAEVTILGPDRMSIRLFRKRDGGDANAKAIDKPKRKHDAEAEASTKVR